jgi:hypothetical protein
MVKEDDRAEDEDEAESTTTCPRGGEECPLKNNYVGALISRDQVERYSRHMRVAE